MNVQALSAVVFSSREPEGLADFYRSNLGIPFEAHSHGPMRHHQEAWLEGMHFAVLKGTRGAADTRGISATFRVRGLDAFVDQLGRSGVTPLTKIIELGEGKRLVSFRDRDENLFSLIDLGF